MRDGDAIDWLEELERAASARPWRARHQTRGDETGEVYGWVELASPAGLVLAGCEERDGPDARLVAPLRNAAPELLAVVREAEEATRPRPHDGRMTPDREGPRRLRAALRALRARLDEVRDA